MNYLNIIKSALVGKEVKIYLSNGLTNLYVPTKKWESDTPEIGKISDIKIMKMYGKSFLVLVEVELENENVEIPLELPNSLECEFPFEFV